MSGRSPVSPARPSTIIRVTESTPCVRMRLGADEHGADDEEEDDQREQEGR